MKKSKHIPGPWVFSSRNDTYDMMIISESRNMWIVDVPSHPLNETQKANFQLIAAAPEMLDALEALLSAQPNEATTEPLRSAIVLASLAVQKAKGGNSGV